MRSAPSRRSVSEARHAPPRRATTRTTTVRKTVTKAKSSTHHEEPLHEPSLIGSSFFQQGLLTPDQKRELILAHASARQTRTTPRGWMYVFGVAAACLMVAGGWWMTVGSWIHGKMELAKEPTFQESVRNEIANMEILYPIQKPTLADIGSEARREGASSTQETTP
ncbi:hypothetical protein KBB27_01105 [Patescibacteria group bacterium]|nr:hypothetical protein [Patescibacteria group bacterium]